MTIEALVAVGLLTIVVIIALLIGAVVALARQVGDNNRLLKSVLSEWQQTGAASRPKNQVPTFLSEKTPE